MHKCTGLPLLGTDGDQLVVNMPIGHALQGDNESKGKLRFELWGAPDQKRRLSPQKQAHSKINRMTGNGLNHAFSKPRTPLQ